MKTCLVINFNKNVSNCLLLQFRVAHNNAVSKSTKRRQNENMIILN